MLPPNEATASIPAKSLSGTLADRAPPTQAVRLLSDTKLAVVRHIDAIKRAQQVLGDGSKQLRSLATEEDSYWRNILGISGSGGDAEEHGATNVHGDDTGEDAVSTQRSSLYWALLPRPLSNGLPPNRQIATDVMIPYAPNEGGLS